VGAGSRVHRRGRLYLEPGFCCLREEVRHGGTFGRIAPAPSGHEAGAGVEAHDELEALGVGVAVIVRAVTETP
jgi:hypothetical protein